MPRVDRIAVGNEPGDVGDRIAKDKIAPGLLDRERLIEIGRARRIERDERDVRAVDMVRQRLARRRFGRGLNLRREVARQLELRSDRREALVQRAWTVLDRLQDLTIVTCATSIAPPRKPPSQYMR